MMEVASDNISNSNTPGYKSGRTDVIFKSILDSPISSVDYKNSSPGKMVFDSRPNVYSLEHGLFVLQDDAGHLLYKRSLAMNVNNNGMVVGESGAELQGRSGPVFVGEKSFSISEAGDVLVDGVAVDTLSVANSASGDVYTDHVRIIHGYIEQSNVNLSSEVQTMLEASRSFKALQSGLNRYDHMLSLINDYVRDVK